MVLPVEPVSDEELVAKYRSQPDSPAAKRSLDELFQRHQRRVALWCLRMAGNRESAADLAQEVFLKAFRHLDSYRGDSKFSTWLYSITRNHCFNDLKSRAQAPEETTDPLLTEFVDRTPGPDVQMEQESRARLLRDLIGTTLTETESQVLNLHYAEELPLDTVTRLLKLQNASGAKALVVSARRKLQRAVDRWKAREQRTRP
jgi:RNA polymerase sigma-70 factor (ECF subfamily)